MNLTPLPPQKFGLISADTLPHESVDDAITAAKELIARRHTNVSRYSTDWMRSKLSAPVYVVSIVAIVSPTSPPPPPVSVQRFDTQQ